MPAPKGTSKERRAEIIQAIQESGYLKMPTQREMAKRFGVTEAQISVDMKEIKKMVPGEDPLLAGIAIEKFADEALRRLEELKKNATDDRSIRKTIMAQMRILEHRINILLKLGLIEQAPQKVDTTLKIRWANE